MEFYLHPEEVNLQQEQCDSSMSSHSEQNGCVNHGTHGAMSEGHQQEGPGNWAKIGYRYSPGPPGIELTELHRYTSINPEMGSYKEGHHNNFVSIPGQPDSSRDEERFPDMQSQADAEFLDSLEDFEDQSGNIYPGDIPDLNQERPRPSSRALTESFFQSERAPNIAVRPHNHDTQTPARSIATSPSVQSERKSPVSPSGQSFTGGTMGEPLQSEHRNSSRLDYTDLEKNQGQYGYINNSVSRNQTSENFKQRDREAMRSPSRNDLGQQYLDVKGSSSDDSQWYPRCPQESRRSADTHENYRPGVSASCANILMDSSSGGDEFILPMDYPSALRLTSEDGQFLVEVRRMRQQENSRGPMICDIRPDEEIGPCDTGSSMQEGHRRGTDRFRPELSYGNYNLPELQDWEMQACQEKAPTPPPRNRSRSRSYHCIPEVLRTEEGRLWKRHSSLSLYQEDRERVNLKEDHQYYRARLEKMNQPPPDYNRVISSQSADWPERGPSRPASRRSRSLGRYGSQLFEGPTPSLSRSERDIPTRSRHLAGRYDRDLSPEYPRRSRLDPEERRLDERDWYIERHSRDRERNSEWLHREYTNNIINSERGIQRKLPREGTDFRGRQDDYGRRLERDYNQQMGKPQRRINQYPSTEEEGDGELIQGPYRAEQNPYRSETRWDDREDRNNYIWDQPRMSRREQLFQRDIHPHDLNHNHNDYDHRPAAYFRDREEGGFPQRRTSSQSGRIAGERIQSRLSPDYDSFQGNPGHRIPYNTDYGSLDHGRGWFRRETPHRVSQSDREPRRQRSYSYSVDSDADLDPQVKNSWFNGESRMEGFRRGGDLNIDDLQHSQTSTPVRYHPPSPPVKLSHHGSQYLSPERQLPHWTEELGAKGASSFTGSNDESRVVDKGSTNWDNILDNHWLNRSREQAPKRDDAFSKAVRDTIYVREMSNKGSPYDKDFTYNSLNDSHYRRQDRGSDEGEYIRKTAYGRGSTKGEHDRERGPARRPSEVREVIQPRDFEFREEDLDHIERPCEDSNIEWLWRELEEGYRQINGDWLDKPQTTHQDQSHDLVSKDNAGHCAWDQRRRSSLESDLYGENGVGYTTCQGNGTKEHTTDSHLKPQRFLRNQDTPQQGPGSRTRVVAPAVTPTKSSEPFHDISIRVSPPCNSPGKGPMLNEEEMLSHRHVSSGRSPPPAPPRRMNNRSRSYLEGPWSVGKPCEFIVDLRNLGYADRRRCLSTPNLWVDQTEEDLLGAPRKKVQFLYESSGKCREQEILAIDSGYIDAGTFGSDPGNYQEFPQCQRSMNDVDTFTEGHAHLKSDCCVSETEDLPNSNTPDPILTHSHNIENKQIDPRPFEQSTDGKAEIGGFFQRRNSISEKMAPFEWASSGRLIPDFYISYEMAKGKRPFGSAEKRDSGGKEATPSGHDTGHQDRDDCLPGSSTVVEQSMDGAPSDPLVLAQTGMVIAQSVEDEEENEEIHSCAVDPEDSDPNGESQKQGRSDDNVDQDEEEKYSSENSYGSHWTGDTLSLGRMIEDDDIVPEGLSTCDQSPDEDLEGKKFLFPLDDIYITIEMLDDAWGEDECDPEPADHYQGDPGNKEADLEYTDILYEISDVTFNSSSQDHNGLPSGVPADGCPMNNPVWRTADECHRYPDHIQGRKPSGSRNYMRTSHRVAESKFDDLEVLVEVPVLTTQVVMEWMQHSWVLLENTKEFTERRKIRAALRDLIDSSTYVCKKTEGPMEDIRINLEALKEHGGLLDDFSSNAEKRASFQFRKKHGMLLTKENIQNRLESRRKSQVNPYEKITDVEELTKKLKEATNVEDRVHIRSVLRKIRESNNDVENEQTKEATPESEGSDEVVKNGTSNHCDGDVDDTNVDTNVIGRDYSEIEDVHELEDMLFDTEDYAERKKIRTAIHNLRKKRLATLTKRLSNTEDNMAAPRCNHSETKLVVNIDQDPPPSDSIPKSADPRTDSEDNLTENNNNDENIPVSLNSDVTENNEKNMKEQNGIEESEVTLERRSSLTTSKTVFPWTTLPKEENGQVTSHHNMTGHVTNHVTDTLGVSMAVDVEDQERQTDNGANVELELTSSQTMDDLNQRLNDLENKLDVSKDFDSRREIRAAIREVRSQIRENTMKMSSRHGKRDLGKPPLSKTSCLTDSCRPPKEVSLARSFSTKEQGRNFLARKLQSQLVRSSSTREAGNRNSAPPGSLQSKEVGKSATANGSFNIDSQRNTMSDYSAFNAITTKRIRRGDTRPAEEFTGINTATKDQQQKETSCEPLIKDTSNSTDETIDSVDAKIIVASLTDHQRKSCRGSDGRKEPRRLLAIGDRTLNMSKASSGYGSVSGSEEEKEEDKAEDGVLPEILQPLSDVTFNDGETVTFTCKVTGGQNAKICWYKDSKLLKSMEDFQQSFDGSEAKLTLTEVFEEDSGEYKCIVTTSGGKAETAAFMTVIENASLVAPSVEKPLTDLTVKDGDTVTFECEISGMPTPKLTWFKGSNLLKESPDFNQTFQDGIAKLRMEDVFPDDNGTYICVAINDAGECRSTCRLTVEEEVTEDAEAPDIISPLENLDALDGDTVTFSCKISGSPKPMLTWYRDDKLLPNCSDFEQSYDGKVAKLVIDGVFEQDTGDYKVIAKNSAGEASIAALLNVKGKLEKSGELPSGKPKFTSPLQSELTVIDGQSVSLECQLNADPNPNILWYKDGRVLRPSIGYKQTFDGSVAKIEIREVFLDDTGMYECAAKNGHGEERCSCKLKVKENRKERNFEDTFERLRSASKKPVGGSTGLSRVQSMTVKLDERSRLAPGGSTGLTRVQSLKDRLDNKIKWTQQQTLSGVTRKVAKMPDAKDIDSIDDEDVLHTMMTETTDFTLRKKIRARMRDVREAKSADFQKKQDSMGKQEDAVHMRQRIAEHDKERKLKEMDKFAKIQRERTDIGERERAIRERHQKADEEKQKKLEGYKEMGKVMSQVYQAGTDLVVKLDQAKSAELKAKHFGKGGTEDSNVHTTKTERGGDGSTTTTNVTTSRRTTKDGSSVTTTQTKQVTQVGGLGKTSYTVKKTSAASTTTSGGGKAPNFLEAGGGQGAGGRVAVQRSPSAIKDMLLAWCKQMTKDYENVEIKNFSSSWNDGMAFAALIHHFRPVFDYKRLNPKCRRGNFKLAFDVAEKFADIAPLLDVDDMVKMKNPDWKCVFTYVQSFYRRFRDDPLAQPGGVAKAE